MSKPYISVIVPAHNESSAIASTLESLLSQDYSSYEIIVACNGCTDDTAEVARGYCGVRVFESEKSGMSWGKNFGAQHAEGDVYVFVDADTQLSGHALQVIEKEIGRSPAVVGTMGGAPDRGGAVVRICFMIANHVTRKKKVHAPGGVMVMHRAVFESVGGFAEDIPQGTSTDLILRARQKGAEYLYVKGVKAITSIRRFEKTGIIQQMLKWRDNHKRFEQGEREVVRDREYDNVRRDNALSEERD